MITKKKQLGTLIKQKVFVAMSGGVDSSVSATLLVKAGYQVTGVFMKVWQPDFLPCNWQKEQHDAMRVAALLGIPLLTWDFEKEYKEGVADYMIREYREGRTPNPDVMCNKEIKFGVFFDRAMSMGADFVATGHYAQIKKMRKQENNKTRTQYNAPSLLLRGVDIAKDQSYFLWTLGQKQLPKTLFPIGGYKKSQVRVLAKKFKLPVAEKKDSQGLCFVGKLDMKDFLAHFIEKKEGVVINENGEVIGTHRGAYFYTLGERHDFTITKKLPNDLPYYVVSKDIKKNIICVTHKKNKKTKKQKNKKIVEQVNFCVGFVPDITKKYIAQIRYHGESYRCSIISCNDSRAVLCFIKPIIVASGQSIVLYQENECVGGGVVE